ncbi:MAG: ferredoxin reductase [Alphaproteobacteria bacterium]|nr:ferredoxin reductase [Alphaproteobacteria bacterium]
MSGEVSSGLPWLLATAAATKSETPRVKTVVFDVPRWRGHLAGQHVDIRLTAEDGYQAQRSYSIASPQGSNTRLELTVEHVEEGEVSPFLLDVMALGDTIELRGPIGGYFTWRPGETGPVMLIAGGSGVVPLMSMLRTRASAGDRTPVRLLYSSRTQADIIYRGELDAQARADDGVAIVHTLTRAQPPGWVGERGRIDQAMLRKHCWPATERPRIFVCGPTPFVEAVADALVALEHAPERIKTERFGPTGDLA